MKVSRVVSHPLSGSGRRGTYHQAVCRVGESLFEFQSCEEVPDGRICTLDQTPESIVPPFS